MVNVVFYFCFKLLQIKYLTIPVCDPVMGDNGEMYVPKELLPIYKANIITLADIITPNQYEAELLTDIKVKNVEDALKAIDIFHEMGCKTVVLSSTELGDDNNLLALASSRIGMFFLKLLLLKYGFNGISI